MHKVKLILKDRYAKVSYRLPIETKIPIYPNKKPVDLKPTKNHSELTQGKKPMKVKKLPNLTLDTLIHIN